MYQGSANASSKDTGSSSQATNSMDHCLCVGLLRDSSFLGTPPPLAIPPPTRETVPSMFF